MALDSLNASAALLPRYGVMLLTFAAIWLVPVKLNPRGLMSMAGMLWMMGGLSLLMVGAQRLLSVWPQTSMMLMMGVLAATVLIGALKGVTILSKTATRNIVRLQAVREPLPVRQIYELRSWILIAVMIGLSMTLNLMDIIPVLARGAINAGIGLALVVSSLRYWRALGSTPSSTLAS